MTALFLRMSRAALFVGAAATLAAPARAQAPMPPATITPIAAPRTPLPPESATAGITHFSFISYGDSRGRHDGTDVQAEHRLVIESMLQTIKKSAGTASPIAFVLESGDAVQDGSIAAQVAVSYAPLVSRVTQDAGVPFFLAVGNHDVGNSIDLTNPRRVQGLQHYLAANELLIPGDGSPRRLAGYPTYAFGYGNSFFIAFDSNIPDDSTQLAWVRAQLAGLDRSRYVNVVLFFHHPPFSSGGHGGASIERQAASIREKWMPMLRQYHVRLLLTGHEHLFEHWVERYTDATGPHRIDEIVSGGGGAPLTVYKGEPDLKHYLAVGAAEKVSLQHLVKPSPVPGANPFHYVVVRVDGADISVEVVGVDWGKGFAPYQSNGASLTDRK